MTKLSQYSGIATKIRSMQSRLITPNQYDTLRTMGSVSEALTYLKQLPGYAPFLQDLEESQAHRGQIEAMLTASLYHDFSKLYRFANMQQRKFMDFYFIHYESVVLKDCLRRAYSGADGDLQLLSFQHFFEQHSSLNLVRLNNSSTLEEFIRALSGNTFYPVLRRAYESGIASLPDYESILDQFYFCTLWKEKRQILKGLDQNIITSTVGYRIDLLNLRWIYRAKKYYRMNADMIYSMLISCYYKIRPSQIQEMVASSSIDELLHLIHLTYYGQRYGEQLDDIHSMELLYAQLTEKIYTVTSRNHPYSIAPINSYLYFKEHETRRLTTIIEGIRYGISPDEIASYAVN
ncbi:MAG: V-type ATPase subunit [Clostridiales bacterium]|nr:V-type ATPase subunit [Clostridiales bacterium]